jgi:hypothetical protein
MNGPRWGEARLSANVEFDFFGGEVVGPESNGEGALRLRTAAARIDWARTSLAIGQQSPLISPLNPTSLASSWYPSMTSAGNLWLWQPQVLFEHRAPLDEQSTLVWQGGVILPFSEAVGGTALSSGPSYESRFAFRRSIDAERNLEFGLGGHFGRRTFSFGRKVSDFAITGDWLAPLHERVELSGEIYYSRGLSLGELTGNRIDRVFVFSGPQHDPATTIRGLHAIGGWAQLSFQARQDLEFNFAYGQDDPRNRDIFSGVRDNSTRFKNQAATANFIYQLRPNFLVSIEYRRLWTDYAAARRTNGHVNLAVGYVF